jgi:hypothetical protein
MENVLYTKISFQQNIWSGITDQDLTIREVLGMIKSGTYNTKVLELRNLLDNNNQDEYNNKKKSLPAVTFSATFIERRSQSNVKNYNSIIVLDIDKLDTDQILECERKLMQDKYVFSYWRSPSNRGFKGLVRIQFSGIDDKIGIDQKHKSAFYKLSRYFDQELCLKIDNSGSDITRLCLLSYDTNLVVKENITYFEVLSADLNLRLNQGNNNSTSNNGTSERDKLYNPYQKNSPVYRKQMTDIIRFLTKKGLSITFDYESWFRVAMAIANSFTYDVGLKYFLKLSAMDCEKYDEENCKKFLAYCYSKTKKLIKFTCIIDLAKEKGFRTRL